MCGILFWLRCKEAQRELMEKGVEALVARGPEGARIVDTSGASFGFTRLAINGLTEAGMQPFESGPLTYICNGEIYNAHALETSLAYQPASGSDCEVLGALWEACGADTTAFCRALDGVFALALEDRKRKRWIVARDPYGVRPLYWASGSMGYAFASERKALVPFADRFGAQIDAFPPGQVWVFDHVMHMPEKIVYHTPPWLKNPGQPLSALVEGLDRAVEKRLLTERPVAALLSGGIDSSLIAALVQKKLKALGKPPLKTFSIGMPGATDLAYARKVAEWIGSDHTEVIVSADEMFDAIPAVIHDIESYDITTVRASVGNWLVAKAIRAQTDCKVVFNGDGSDEIFGSYKYFKRAPNDFLFEAETQRLLREIHQYDVLRSDRSISAHGLEARTPFLDKQFVAIAMAFPTEMRRPSSEKMEKWVLREAFKDTGLLPPEVLWRSKEAFSDGVSAEEKSWYQIVQEKVRERGVVPVDGWRKILPGGDYAGVKPEPRTDEAYWYLTLYEKDYGKTGKWWAYWMPRWSPETSDPSARTLATV